MILWLWQNWQRHKKRFMFVMIGAVIISVSLGSVAGFPTTNNGPLVIEASETRWHAPYDILVRPPESRTVTEKKDLLNPAFLSGISGGISLDQYEKVKQADGVAVAAPVSMIGYTGYAVVLKKVNIREQGIYRLRRELITDVGPREIVDEFTTYFARGWDPNGKGSGYGLGFFGGMLRGGTSVLLAAVDPEQEARLIGLDKAVSEKGDSNYFSQNDEVRDQGRGYRIPVLFSNQGFVDKTYRFTIERLDLPFEHPDQTMEKVKKKGGITFLNKLQAESTLTYISTSKHAYEQFLKGATGIDPETGKRMRMFHGLGHRFSLFEKTSPLSFKPVTSPYRKRWPYAYEVKVIHEEKPVLPAYDRETFRPVKVFGKDFHDWVRITPEWIGFYNPDKLEIPDGSLPMMYRPSPARWVLDARGKPVNPRSRMKPADSAFGLITPPPTMITTIEAAAKILGDHPISAIRVKAAGVDHAGEEILRRLEGIAQKIESETGLVADVIFGSSPKPVLTHVPAKGNLPELGWIVQPWIKPGPSPAVFREASVGFPWVVGCLILIAVMYVMATNAMTFVARRKELAALQSNGWKPKQLVRMFFLESLFFGGFVAVMAWAVLSWISSVHGVEGSAVRLMLAAVPGFAIYALGAVIPAVLLSRFLAGHEPVLNASRAMWRIRSIMSFVLGHLFTGWRLSLLSVVMMVIPAGLLTFFLWISFRLKGALYMEWLDQYVALEVGAAHFAVTAVALLMATLVIAQVMRQNVSERRPQFALMKAVGWRNNGIRLSLWLEGGLMGLCAGVAGLLLASGLIFVTYGEIPHEDIWFLLATGTIPMAAGLLGAMLPAEKAARTVPYQGTKDAFAPPGKSETSVRWVFRIIAVALVAGFAVRMAQPAPDAAGGIDAGEQLAAAVPTSGNIDNSKPVIRKKDHENTRAPVTQVSGEPRDSGVGRRGSEENVVTVQLGQKVEGPRGGYSFSIHKMDATPPKAKLKKTAEGMKYVSFQVIFRVYEEYGSVEFRPYNMDIRTSEGVKDEAGWTIVENHGWSADAGAQMEKGKAVVDLTFEVPEQDRQFTLVWKVSPDDRKKYIINVP
ncbi:MAG TPA: ABC transporter permease [Bacillales bacterium]|nr:ABC transporter permease [Bacillales bacterium]